MNLQVHLLSRIVFAATICLLLSTAYTLYSSDQESKSFYRELATSLSKQLQLQLVLRPKVKTYAQQFPDFSLWQQTQNVPGLCLSFKPANNELAHQSCTGEVNPLKSVPALFSQSYLKLFRPEATITQVITYNGKNYGELTLKPSAAMQISKTWDKALNLFTLSTMTLVAVCILVLISIRRALFPAKVIVNGLAQLAKEQLNYRLPSFALREWQETANAINQLAVQQHQLLEERQNLNTRLLQVQENERRELARELHDEFGQCLTAINSIAAAIAYSPEDEVAAEAQQISVIVEMMLDHLGKLLGRLRPIDLDELGLNSSLQTLLNDWTQRTKGKPTFEYIHKGAANSLPQDLTLTLFRLTQEAVQNIIKHAHAQHALVSLTIEANQVNLCISDDGIATALPPVSTGFGLLGIRERVSALKGSCQLSLAQPHGLVLNITLPLSTQAIRQNE